MSSTVAVEADENVCANCGIVAVDHVKLKKCACNLVKYCSVGCQKQHRPKHKREHARNGCLKYTMTSYSGNPIAVILGNAPSVACRYRLIHENL
jgi:hypothetical protein